MDRCKLSSIRYSAGLLIILVFMSGCSAYRVKRISTLSPDEAEKLDVDGAERDSLETKKKMFAYYCSGGKQLRAVKTRVTYISPKPPQGIPLNEATDRLNRIDKLRQCFLAKAFRALSAGEISDWNWRMNQLLDTRFFTTTASTNEILTHAKALRVDASFFQPIFVSSEKSGAIFLILERVDHHDRLFKEARFNQGYTTLFELNVFRKGFTLVTPKETQRNIFFADEESRGGDADLRDCGRLSGSLNVEYYEVAPSKKFYGFFGYDRDGNFQPTMALQDRESAWDRYFEIFTTIKEASTDDPQITNYELSLDLNHFCKYGRPTDDFFSK